MKKLLIVTYDRYPEGNAGAVREHIFAKAYEQMGYAVTVIGMGESTDFLFKDYDGVKYISLRNKGIGIVNKIQNKFLYKKRLKKLLYTQNPDALLFTQIPLSSMMMLKKFALKKQIPIIHDSVEWFTKDEYKCWLISKTYYDNEILNRFLIDKNVSVIAISEYLREHFSKKTKNVCRIPFVLDTADIEYNKKLNDNKIVIMYAGSIGKKDSFVDVIDAFGQLNDSEKERLELRVIGYSKEGFMKVTQIPEEKLALCEKCIKFLGRVQREEVKKNLAEANFTILMRPSQKRYAKAGFPTKVTESLSYYTPVIANLSSDLHLYLQDGINSIVVEENTAGDVLNALRRVLTLDRETLEEMSKAAGETAKTMLDYRLFKKELEELICDR